MGFTMSSCVSVCEGTFGMWWRGVVVEHATHGHSCKLLMDDRSGNRTREVRVWTSWRRKIRWSEGSACAADGCQRRHGDVTASAALLTSAQSYVIYVHICRQSPGVHHVTLSSEVGKSLSSLLHPATTHCIHRNDISEVCYECEL